MSLFRRLTLTKESGESGAGSLRTNSQDSSVNVAPYGCPCDSHAFNKHATIASVSSSPTP